MLFGALFLGLATATSVTAINKTISAALDKVYIVQLSAGTQTSLNGRSIDHLGRFHKRAASLKYTVRHEFTNSDVFLGLSVQVTGDTTDEESLAELERISGVLSVSRVYNINLATAPVDAAPLDPLLSYSAPPPLPLVTGTGNLGSALQMGGVDKLHQAGILGKGIKIGVVDTGVDYRHPALGGGFGPGFKIAGGYSFVLDNGTLQDGPDPLVTCYGGGHGTHVSGILGMNAVPGSFNITGVAPAAEIFMYRVFDCSGNAGSDTIIAAMSKAQEDGVNIVSMSLGIGEESFNGAVDPVQATTQALTSAGIAVIVANANDASGSEFANNLYTEEWPSSDPTAIAVGAISNTLFPLVYPAQDSLGATIHYASVWPLAFPNGADVFIIADGCDSSTWDAALAAIKNVNETIIAFQVDQNCKGTSVNGMWSGSPVAPVYILAFNADSTSTDPYLSAYDTPSQGYFGTTEFINLNSVDGDTLVNNYNTAGGYLKYKLKFTNGNFQGVPQPSGGLMDYYSSWGPTWHNYNLKPQISSPGGHVLSTWPLGPLGGYAILSGTSMATPYIAASYALVKSVFPTATIEQIKDRLQANANPVPWIYNKTQIASTAQQGAGLVNVYNAIFSQSTISPGQLLVSDVSKTVYGVVNITIQNLSPGSKTYTLAHEGAGYSDYYLAYEESNQLPIYGTAHFPTPTITIPAGKTSTISFTINSPASGVSPSNLPVFGGFIKVTDSSNNQQSIPYAGPPYSLYNTPQILVTKAVGGVQLPEVYALDSSGNVDYDTGLLSITPANGYTGSIATLQWTENFILEVLPANTNIIPSVYGFNTSVIYPYQPSAFAPNSTIFGYKSFGTLLNVTGWSWPGAFGPWMTDTSIAGDNGELWFVGPGDYRWFASVLKQGGTIGVQSDYETWLGPVMRLVSY